MSIEEILDSMDETLDQATKLPLMKGKVSVDAEQFREYIKQIRLNLPTEIRQAQHLVDDRRGIINDAKAEANSILRKAEEQANKLISEEAITKQAQQRAHDILTTAQSKSKEIKNATNVYVDGMLTRLEDVLTSNIADVRKTLGALRNNKS
ncbi:MAG: ATP synthase F0 subunit B [Ruminococcaceae bacterium]|nr:ATP synthase F0 subunit B [Oscillospiraceae bacterium]